MAFAVSFIVVSPNLLAATESGMQGLDQDTLKSVANLYSISESQAIDRMSREADAAYALRRVEELSLESYAGSWFDPSTMKLKVAIANSNDLVHLKGLAVEPVIVENSLAALREKLRAATARTNVLENLGSSVIMSYVDIRANKAILTVDRPFANTVRSALAEFEGMVDVVEGDSTPVLSTGDVRAADGTFNPFWGLPCSIGA